MIYLLLHELICKNLNFRYREAGAQVIGVLNKFCSCVERASVDEAYIDMTTEVTERMTQMTCSSVDISQIPNTFVEGYDRLEGNGNLR